MPTNESVFPAEPAGALPAPAVAALTASEEQTWSVLAHLSVLLNLVTGFAGPIAAGIIFLVYKDRSRRVAYHALQSAIMQLICWYGGGVLATVLGIVAVVFSWTIVIPFVCAVLGLLIIPLPLGGLIYGIVGAVQVNQGQDFKYWLVGDWVRGTLNG